MGTRSKAAAAGDTQKGILNELTAYEQDILLIDVIQDDSELFESVTQESLLKLGPTKVPKPGPIGQVLSMFPRLYEPSPAIEQRLTSVKIDVLCDIPDITEDGEDRPWRPHTSSKEQSTRPAKKSQTEKLDQPDSNNNHERMWPIKSVTCLPNHVCPPKTVRNGSWITSLANKSEFRHQKSNAYCRLYFSESLSCGFKMCRFQHVPMEGDEKFCVETVVRFTKNSMCLQKAGAVFAGYYHNNPPGVYFSMPMFLSLIWSLLKAGMISDVFSVLRVSLAHKIVPDYDFLLALFNYVREKGLMGLVPELMQLTFMMANSGLALSLDCLDCVKNTPEVQQTICPKSVSSKLSTITPVPEYLNLAHAVVEIELCSKQEDWRQMGEVFRSICQSNQRTNLMEQISGRIAIALLSESKDKLSLPFATFAETVCQDDEDSLARVFLGRIGVSLMLRYHKTHQWYKGQRVVEVLCISKVDYSTLKGLFGNEDNASRCFLITVATELFLFSGSLEGALNILRENKWFLSSASWPCNPDDLESRARLLTRLAEKTSHRDTLEVLCNLPGLQEPTDVLSSAAYPASGCWGWQFERGRPETSLPSHFHQDL
ncbi:protein TOPAZ1 isoform X2 [Antennarius striatus]|uniref:protein TOPAZ1 isoform X2 n=1 Tax=Antennarius striatus TaxID=241820 RepID=UPI0035B44300